MGHLIKMFKVLLRCLKKRRECLFRDYLTGMHQVVRIVFPMAMKLLTVMKEIIKEAGSDIENINGKHKYFIYL